MVQKLDRFYVNLKQNKVLDLASRILFPLLLIAYAYVKVNKGGDISDTTYSYSNFMNLDAVDGMWFYSTFYANLIGRLLTYLPFGHLMLGLNIYTGIFKALLGLSAYYFFAYEVRVDRCLSFVGALISIGLCWCPTATLYNYLTYLLFFLGAAFLYRALIKEQEGCFIIAGFFLGSNVFVRLPNVVEAALILAVFIYAFVKKEKPAVWLKKTGLSILGYLLAFIPAIVLIALTRGFGAYFEGIGQLFGMTEQATNYSSLGMVLSIVNAYVAALKISLPLLLALIIGLLLNLASRKLGKLRLLAAGLSVMAVLAALLYYYKKNIFNFNYHTHEATYRLGTLFMVISVVLFLYYLLKKSSTMEERMLTAIAGIVMAITPIGSNNEIYSNLNNMFFVIPVFLYLIIRFTDESKNFNILRLSALTFALAFFFQSFLFGFTFIFRDGTDGDMNVAVDNDVYKGMRTTAINAERLQGVTDIWKEYNLKGEPVLLYGDCPGLSFYLESPIAISTAWPSLGSFSVEKFARDMEELDAEATRPPVIIGCNLESEEKQEILNDYLDKNGYKEIYTCDMFKVLISEETK